MPTKRNRLERQIKVWNPPYWEFPTTEPQDTRNLFQEWADDLIISQNNGISQVKRLGRHDIGDVGGNFLVHRRYYSDHLLGGGGDVHFSWSLDPTDAASPYWLGNQYPYREEFNSGHFPNPGASSDAELAAWGTTAIARVSPTKPLADLGSFLGEAREGLPSAVGMSLTGRQRALACKNAGDEYLNVEFGWKPLIRDVKAFASSIINSDRLLKEYHKNSGVLLKRRYTEPETMEVKKESDGLQFPLPLMHPWVYRSPPQTERFRFTTSKKKRWFTGSFMYYVPEIGSPHRYLSDANHLLGVKLTPETLWNIAPWSWAADWVGNTGDIMSNLSSFSTDCLAMHHAYVMETSSVKVEYVMYPTDVWWSHPGAHTLSQSFTTVSKKRIAATPYGFGLDWDDFSSKQFGILAALGISRTHK